MPKTLVGDGRDASIFSFLAHGVHKSPSGEIIARPRSGFYNSAKMIVKSSGGGS
jgi:hypothetical protein